MSGGATPNARVCMQCGRSGTRGFTETPVVYEGIDYGSIIQCANRKACARRYERQRPRGWLEDA